MPFYELIYETGSKSVAYYESDDEMKAAVANHHSRAVAGEDGGPHGGPAERVIEVQKYDEHPGDYMMSQMLDKKEVEAMLKKALDDVAMGGQVSVPELAARVRDMTNPLVEAPGRQESAYKTEAAEVFHADSWEGKN